MFPNHLARFSVEALQQTADAELVNAVGLRVTDGARPPDPFGRHIAEEHVVDILPNQLARFGVETDRLFAFARRLGERAADRIHPTIHGDWR